MRTAQAKGQVLHIGMKPNGIATKGFSKKESRIKGPVLEQLTKVVRLLDTMSIAE
jgi:hypothetical protein